MPELNNNTFYLTFKDANPSWSLIGCASVLGLIALFGIIFNSSLIYVTIRTKSFRGTVNYFLALCSFFELIHQPGHFLFVYTAFSGQNFIDYRLAVKITFITWFGIAAISPTMFFTGIDRLIGIAFDEMQNKCKIRLYLTTVTVICFAFGLPSADQVNRRTFRSLFCIIAVNVGGYFINMVYMILIKPSISSPITAWFGQVISAIPLNIGAASNGPILYLTSTEYRKAFQKQFPFVFKQISNPTQVVPLPQNGHTMQLVTRNL
ncbi:hypothetical protein niasHT_002921 [Heterodera trifolii]|uniref:G_PROTEIN_RECEP_F1_2 domain-containing protein n=1 Tax=Heterodera trifolii TaxID=157864 RepID=A0ABD2LNZ4_9BILA